VRLEPLPVRATLAEHDDGEAAVTQLRFGVARIAGADQHQLFTEHRLGQQVGVIDRPCDQGRVEPVRQHMLQQLGGGPGAHVQLHVGVRPVKTPEHGGQAHRGGGFHRADAQAAAHQAIVSHGRQGFV